MFFNLIKSAVARGIVVKQAVAGFLMLAFLAACTDYVEQIDGQIEERDAYYDAWAESSINPGGYYVDPSYAFEGTFEDSRDGRTYRMVTIGSQTWMAENLNYETPNSYCYGNNNANCDTYGRLYTWAAAMDSAGEWSSSGKGCGNGKICFPTFPVRGACPDGWHLPSIGEWMALKSAAGEDHSDYQEFNFKLLSKTGWNGDKEHTDDYGFSLLPGGAKMNSGKYLYETTRAYFWAVGEDGANSATGILWRSGEETWGESDEKYFGFSVRCVKDIAEKDTVERHRVSYGSLTDYRDNYVYKTVKIGTQTWMAENLNYHKNDSYCYEEDDSNCDKYGRLYKWDAVATGVCPYGWHLPSRAEWDTLFITVNDGQEDATKLKATSGWNDYQEGRGNGVDTYGFSALPGGRLQADGFSEIGNSAYFWATTENEEHASAEYLWLYSAPYDNAYFYTGEEDFGFSVRCVKNNDPEPLWGSSFFWSGADGVGRVETDFDDEDGTSGFWYAYNDSAEGGSSSVIFPSDVEKNEWDDFFGPLVEVYGGIKATVTFGDVVDPPYAGVAFNIKGHKREGVDISNWGGICITYKSDSKSFNIEIVAEEGAYTVDYEKIIWRVVPKTATEFKTYEIPWENFNSYMANPENLKAVLSDAAVIRLNFEGSAGTSNDFFVKAIGSLSQCE
jgi:uncharacterized protein (TIGR02145 family)